MNYALKYIIEMVIGIYVAVGLLPSAINQLVNTTTTSTWGSGLATIWNFLIPMLVIIGLALVLMPEEIKGKMGL